MFQRKPHSDNTYIVLITPLMKWKHLHVKLDIVTMAKKTIKAAKNETSEFFIDNKLAFKRVD